MSDSQGVGATVGTACVLMTKVVNVRLAVPTVPVMVQHPSVGKVTPLA